MKTKELSKLETHEVSLVPKGANGKRFLLFKNAEGKPSMSKAKEMIDWVTKTFNKETAAAVEKALAPENQSRAVLTDRHKSGLQAIARIAHAMKEEVGAEHFMKALGAAGVDMKDFMHTESQGLEIQGNPDGGVHNPDGDVTGHERDATELLHKDHMKAIPEEVLSDMKDVLKSSKFKVKFDDDEEERDSDGLDDDGLMKAIKMHMGKAYEAGCKAYKEHMEKLGYRRYPDAEVRMKGVHKDIKQVDVSEEAHSKSEAKPMDVTKSLDLTKVDPKTRPALEALFKANQEAVRKAAKLEETLKKEREDRREKEFVEKAATLKVGANSGDVAAILKKLDDSDPKMAEKLESILKANAEQIAKGALFAEHGIQSETPAGGDAWGKIEALADGLVKKSGEKVSKAAAIEEVMNTAEGKRLYDEYIKAKPGLKY